MIYGATGKAVVEFRYGNEIITKDGSDTHLILTGLYSGETINYTEKYELDNGEWYTQEFSAKTLDEYSSEWRNQYYKAQVDGPTTATINIDKRDIADETPVQYIVLSYDGEGISDTLTVDQPLRINGLKPNKKYSLRFDAIMADGCVYRNVKIGGHGSITTPELEFSAVTSKGISSTSAIVSVTTNISEDETDVGFEWRKYDAPAQLASKQGYCAIYDGKLEGRIQGLQSDKYYNIRPFYKTPNGTMYYGEWLMIDPSDFSYVEPIAHSYPVGAVTENSATVRGYVLAGTDDIAEQGFEYWLTQANQAPVRVFAEDIRPLHAYKNAPQVSVVLATGQVMSATLTDLQPSTAYTVRAFVKTSTGKTYYGEEQTFTTPVPAGIIAVPEEAAHAVEHTVTSYYDLSGRRIAEPVQHGVTVVRYADGTTHKVFAR